jgi:hypothetical protein
MLVVAQLVKGIADFMEGEISLERSLETAIRYYPEQHEYV